jgi:hypothetical protein
MSAWLEQLARLINWSAFFQPALIAAVVSVGVAVLTSLLTKWRDEATKRLAFVEKQLAEFYSPLMGLRAEIRARSELREKLNSAADEIWVELVEKARSSGGPTATQALTENRYGEFERLIDWDSKNFYVTLLPAYREMIRIFREKLWLAEPETHAHFSELVAFVEVWERWRDESLPSEIPAKIGHRERNLQGFYDHIEATHTRLRQKLVEGKA